MFDHAGFRVAALGPSRRFYKAAMEALDLSIVDNTETSFLIVRSPDEIVPFFWVGTDRPDFWTMDHVVSASPVHVAFAAKDRAAVDAFHKAALAHGGRDNGAPGPRGPAEAKYYAAFVLDPDGNNIEAGFRS